jgi:molybdate transport system substrate-binding protein
MTDPGDMRTSRILSFLAAALLWLATAAVAKAQDVTVFAAASLTNGLNEVGEAYAASGKGRVRVSYAASSTLARQIERGAPAQVFFSADREWMDYLAERRLVLPSSRVDLLANDLVLVAPADTPMGAVTIARDTSLAALAGDGRIATGDPDHVPVGRYARQALEALGQWSQVESRLARMDSTRSALAMVERGEVPLGIVYATDAAATRKVKVLAVFPGTLHAPVVYPAGLVAGNETPAARGFLDFLGTPQAKGIFIRHGFKVN